jgi:hypothetical protein
MEGPSPTPRWPLYEKRCREWTAALKKLQGEFRRDRFGETLSQLMVIQFAGAGAWLLWATTIGTDTVLDRPWNWFLPALGAVLLGLAVALGRKALGVRYRFMHGEVCEVSGRDHVRWRDPLVTLQSVTFPWQGKNSPQMLTLHWATHHRTIELFMSIEAAARDTLRASQPIVPAERLSGRGSAGTARNRIRRASKSVGNAAPPPRSGDRMRTPPPSNRHAD